MKIKCEVTGVTTDGDNLTISFQGSPEKSAAWRRMGRIEIQVPDVWKSQRAFYVGRKVSLLIHVE
jgi:hypothetical protein